MLKTTSVGKSNTKIRSKTCPVCQRVFKNGTKHLNVHMRMKHKFNWKKSLCKGFIRNLELMN